MVLIPEKLLMLRLWGESLRYDQRKMSFRKRVSKNANPKRSSTTSVEASGRQYCIQAVVFKLGISESYRHTGWVKQAIVRHYKRSGISGKGTVVGAGVVRRRGSSAGSGVFAREQQAAGQTQAEQENQFHKACVKWNTKLKNKP